MSNKIISADHKSSRDLLIGSLTMALVTVFFALLLKFNILIGILFWDLMNKAGVDRTPNINDGSVVAEFEDRTGDLLRELPVGGFYKGNEAALDLIRFSVKKVEYHWLAGAGFVPRHNLVFEFKGKLPNPLGSERGFCLPVMHVFIDAPGKSFQGGSSERVPRLKFREDRWDYQVIVDGMHEQARIFNREGDLVGQGLGLYLNYHEDGDPIAGAGRPGQGVISTRITAALPIDMVGDPSEGEWSYYVVVGLVDAKEPAMMMKPASDALPQIFDLVRPGDAMVVETGPAPWPELLPLKVKN